jgi:hypothetical protein
MSKAAPNRTTEVGPQLLTLIGISVLKRGWENPWKSTINEGSNMRKSLEMVNFPLPCLITGG